MGLHICSYPQEALGYYIVSEKARLSAGFSFSTFGLPESSGRVPPGWLQGTSAFRLPCSRVYWPGSVCIPGRTLSASGLASRAPGNNIPGAAVAESG